MVYLIVLLFSAIGIVAVLGIRYALQRRRISKFVSGIQESTASLEQREADFGEKLPIASCAAPPRSRVRRDVEGLLREARVARSKSNGQEEAERLFIKALTLDPESVAAQMQLAHLYLETQKPVKAEALYRGILLKVQDSSLYASLGTACLQQGKHADAVGAFAAALERDPHSRKLGLELARALIEAGKVTEAIPLLERHATRGLHDAELLTLLAECYEKLQNRKQAREVYERLANLQPQNPLIKEKLAEYALLV